MSHQFRRVISLCLRRDFQIWKLTAHYLPKYIDAVEYMLIVPDDEVSFFVGISPLIWTIRGESEYSYNHSKITISKRLSGKNIGRSGWYLQQFIKINAAIDPALSNDDRVLIWDADTVPLKKLKFTEGLATSKMAFYSSDEFHEPYSHTLLKVFNLKQIGNRSFVAQCIPAKVSWLRDMIGLHHDYVDAVLDAMLGNDSSEFSEYQTIGHYIFLHHRSSVYLNFRPWSRGGVVEISRFKLLNKLTLYLYSLFFDYIAYEHWQERIRLSDLINRRLKNLINRSYIVNLFRRIYANDFHANLNKAIRHLNKKLNNRPDSHPFVSGDSFRRMADIVYEGQSNILDNIDANVGNIIFCETHRLTNFILEVLPSINQPFVLITHNSDDCILALPDKLITNKYLYRWYAQNNILNHPKLISIPIGLENAWMHNNGVVKYFIASRGVRLKKKSKIFYSFTIGNNPDQRTVAADALSKTNLAVHSSWISPKKHVQLLTEYMFVASPPGNGIDCHRTWEALYCGAIPVVVKSIFFDGFKNFPGLILNSWGDLATMSECDLIEIYHSKATQLKNSEYMWMNYWNLKIRRDSNDARHNLSNQVTPRH